MDRQEGRPSLPGMSVLGGASCGLSYEGALRDAVAQEERLRRLQAGPGRGMPQMVAQGGRLDGGRVSNQQQVAGR